MHTIEPYYRWETVYRSVEDERSPFYEVDYNFQQYSNTIYGYYIHPYWDFFGSETLYLKVIYANYHQGYAMIELIGEWNDALYNDIMFLKREVITHMIDEGIKKFILIGENILNFHGSDDCYYEEWFEEVEDGWIAAVNFREHVLEEWKNYNVDWYINFGGDLDVVNWRTLKPAKFFQLIDSVIMRRIELT